MCPTTLSNHIDMNISRLTSYEIMKRKIERYLEQVASQSAATPMDVGSFDRGKDGGWKGYDKGEGRGWKGYDKGKGKGKDQGSADFAQDVDWPSSMASNRIVVQFSALPERKSE